MGVHTGSASPVNGRYRGLAVHRAARISAAAHGGQVIVSQATQSLLEDEAAARVELDPAGDMQVETIVPLPSGPTAIAIGSGSVWAADSGENVVRRIHPDTGEVLEVIEVASAPVAVAVGAGGVWVAGRSDDSVTRLDPLTNTAAEVIPVGDSPIAVAVGERAVWVANSGDGTVSRIDPSTNAVTATISVGHHPQGVAVTDDAVWVTVGD